MCSCTIPPRIRMQIHERSPTPYLFQKRRLPVLFARPTWVCPAIASGSWAKTSAQPLGAHHRFWLRRINILTLLAFDAASTPHRANRLRQEKLDFPIQGSALSRSEFSQAGLEIRWNTYQ